jgi:hypothetical protein
VAGYKAGVINNKDGIKGIKEGIGVLRRGKVNN